MPTVPVRPKRPIFGASAVLLPYCDAGGTVDWDGFDTLVAQTRTARLVPAVNMDTGYANLIDEATRTEVLDRTVGGSFIAGVFVGDAAGDRFDLDAYCRHAEPIVARGGVPILFQSFGLASLADDALIDAYRAIGERIGDFYAFELGTMFAPFGRIYSLDEYTGLLEIAQCLGAKHSSLSRIAEWDRLKLRDERRSDFRILTGNDLAIDMVMYGSDYLLGLAAFWPAAFASRDRLWAAGDDRFFELNDWLQALGAFAFRDPVPAYKHSAAQFLRLRRVLTEDATHPRAATRPESDREVLQSLMVGIADRMPVA